jgi:hypothetical protein
MSRYVLAAIVAGLLASTSIAFAQAPAPSSTASTSTPPAKGSDAVKVPVPAEADLTPPVYTYEVGGRRDPFRSLLIRNPNERTGDRPPGIAGMLVDELDLQGTIKTKAGWVAMMRGSDNKSYLLRKGTTVFDGEVIELTGDQITFRQNVNDPTNPKPFRDVVKSLGLQVKKS